MGEKKRKRKEREAVERQAAAARSNGDPEAEEELYLRLRARLEAELEPERARARELYALLRERLAAEPSAAELRRELEAERAALRREREAWRARSERELREVAPSTRPGSGPPTAVVLSIVAALLLVGGWALAALWGVRDAVRELARAEEPAVAGTGPRTDEAETLALRVASGGTLTENEADRALDLVRTAPDDRGFELALFALARGADARQWSRAAPELARLAAGDGPQAETDRRARALETLAERGDERAVEVAVRLLRDGTEAAELRAAAIRTLAHARPTSSALGAELQRLLESARDLDAMRPAIALLDALVRAPEVESADDASTRADHVRAIAERMLREPFQPALAPDGARPRVVLAERGAGPDAPALSLEPSFDAPLFRRALDELLREAAADASLARFHARVDRLTPQPRSGTGAGAVVRAELGPGAALHLRDGSVLAGADPPRTAEIAIERGGLGAPLVARTPGGPWKPLTHVASPDRIRFAIALPGD